VLKTHVEAARILDADPGSIPAFVLSCIEEHEKQLVSRVGRILKDSPESAVTLVDVPGFPRVCVKQFRWRGRLHAAKGLLRPTQGLRTFRNGWKLLAAGIPVAAPLALVRQRYLGCVTNEYVIMEVIPHALEMDRYLLTRILQHWSTDERQAMAALFGRFIGSMHAEGIFHADLKTCNIMVSDTTHGLSETREPEDAVHRPEQTSDRTIRFALLDYDEVRFLPVVSKKKRIKNLVQIFLSTPVAIRATDRLRFLTEYALHKGMTARQRRETACAVIQAARGRQVLYVGFDGDCREEWDVKPGLAQAEGLEG
jgi:tRNA A-37 threonylcarbamoyl transferase component Bud32